MTEKKFKQVCECQNCGNEAEMEITCTLESIEDGDRKAAPKVSTRPPANDSDKSVKGHGVCSHCGNEADMWIDL